MGRPSAREVIVTLLKALGIAVAILGALFIAGVAFLIVNPPFKSPETGHLRASLREAVRLEPGQQVAVLELVASVNANAFRTNNKKPGPPVVHAELTWARDGSQRSAVSPPPGIRLRLAPVDGPVDGVRVDLERPRVEWSMRCPEPSTSGCRRRYLLLVEASAVPEARTVELDIIGELNYPTWVPTPSWSSFDLRAERIGRRDDLNAELPVARAAGSARLSADRPVALVPLTLEATAATGPTPAAYVALTATITRLTETPPAGLDAPAPVRATILAGAGDVVGRQGFHPDAQDGQLLVPLSCAPSCPSGYLLALEWMDRQPRADYDVTWSVQLVALPGRGSPATPAAILAASPQYPDPVFTARERVEGSQLTRGVYARLVSNNVRSVIHPLVHVHALATAHVNGPDLGSRIVQLQPSIIGGHDPVTVPFALHASESAALALNLEDGCDAERCTGWRFAGQLSDRANDSGYQGAAGTALEDVTITWDIEVRAYGLLPETALLPLELQIDE